MRTPFRCLVIFATVLAAIDARECFAEENATVQFMVTDDNGEIIPCRIHLTDDAGRPQKVVGYPFWNDHFTCSGDATVSLPAGEYRWQIERGPEYERRSGSVTVQAMQTTKVGTTLTRMVSLRDENWYSGDLHVHRLESDIEQLMRSEDLDFAYTIGWWNTPAPSPVAAEKIEHQFGTNRVYCTGAGEDERAGGALLFFGLRTPLDLTVQSREYPSPMQFVLSAREQNRDVWIDIEKPFWWDVPTWLAVAEPDSIGIMHNHMHRGGVLDNEAWGKQRDMSQFPGVHGNGLWTQEIYYHILNCGLHVPPSAGSASGVLPNPVGYNRVYVQLGKQPLTSDNWFAALKSGRCFVTNGPLLRVTANQQFSGESFSIESTREIELEIDLTSNDHVTDLEVIYNGSVYQRIPCADQTEQTLRTTLEVSQPGWFLIRAIADVDHTFRCASTAPWYIKGENNKTRISRRSVDFMLKWIDTRISDIQANVKDVGQRESILKWHLKAKDFYSELKNRSNAELGIERR